MSGSNRKPHLTPVSPSFCLRFGGWRLWGILLFIGLCCGCNALRINGVLDRIVPSNDRQWSPDLARTAYAKIDDQQNITIFNIRNCQYVTESDYSVSYSDRQFHLTDVVGVDFIVVPFNNARAIAHTMLSFRFKDDTYLGCSIEIRSEQGENYNPLLGTARQYELMYLFADERDIIRLRTRHRDAEVYVYPTVATPEKAQNLLIDVLDRANSLAQNPEFYNTITNNCTTNLAGHVNTVADNKIKYNWRVLFPGFSAEYAYQLGLLNQEIPFEDLKNLAYINDLAEQHFDDPEFSRLIRQNHAKISRMIELQRARDARWESRVIRR